MIIANAQLISKEFNILPIDKFIRLLKAVKPNFATLMNNLLERIGYELAYIVRRLIEHDISWGTFWDEDRHRVMGNSHTDNQVVIPRNDFQLLAGIDYDFAVTRDDFVGVNP